MINLVSEDGSSNGSSNGSLSSFSSPAAKNTNAIENATTQLGTPIAQ